MIDVCLKDWDEYKSARPYRERFGVARLSLVYLYTTVQQRVYPSTEEYMLTFASSFFELSRNNVYALFSYGSNVWNHCLSKIDMMNGENDYHLFPSWPCRYVDVTVWRDIHTIEPEKEQTWGWKASPKSSCMWKKVHVVDERNSWELEVPCCFDRLRWVACMRSILNSKFNDSRRIGETLRSRTSIPSHKCTGMLIRFSLEKKILPWASKFLFLVVLSLSWGTRDPPLPKLVLTRSWLLNSW